MQSRSDSSHNGFGTAASRGSSGLMKGFSAYLLMMAITATAIAGDGTVIARAESERSFPHKNSALPPAIKEIYEYYEVCGCSEKDLQCDLKQKSCSWTDGKKYDSVTSWKITWDYNYNRMADVCVADSFRVNVEVTFRYPKWVRNVDAPRPLMEKWDSYLNSLILHENGHRDIVVEAANELSLAVAELPPARSCAELDRTITALSRVRMAKVTKKQNEHDVVTNHGRTEGALFP